jgi:hypothetical protein
MRTCYRMMAKNWPYQTRVDLMPGRLLPHVDRNPVKGCVYLSFRIGKGRRIRLPDDPISQEFLDAHVAAMAGHIEVKPQAGQARHHRCANRQLQGKRAIQGTERHVKGRLHDAVGNDPRRPRTP